MNFDLKTILGGLITAAVIALAKNSFDTNARLASIETKIEILLPSPHYTKTP